MDRHLLKGSIVKVPHKQEYIIKRQHPLQKLTTTTPMCSIQGDQRRWAAPLAASEPPREVIRRESDACLVSMLLCYQMPLETGEDFRWTDRLCISTLQAPSRPVRHDRWLCESPFATKAPLYPMRKEICEELELSTTSCSLPPEPTSPLEPYETSARSA